MSLSDCSPPPHVFCVGGEAIGRLIPTVQAALLKRVGDFGLSAAHETGGLTRLFLGQADSSPSELQTFFQTLAQDLWLAGLIPGWRNESFTVKKSDGTPWFDLERASFRTFGLRSEAVHVHGYTASGEVWLGRRAMGKAIDPGRLDNLAAGGLSSGESPLSCMKRELWEEAGVDEALSASLTALPQTLLSERVETHGVHREWLHCFILQLPESFTPSNQDGEVSEFLRCRADELRKHLSNKALTDDAAMCTEYALQCAAVLDRK